LIAHPIVDHRVDLVRGGSAFGQCFFEMVSGPGEKTKIRDAIRKAAED
jgi:hypothetical protein